MAERGGDRYGEEVSITDHALLTAAAASDQGLADELVAASLLHDVGHLLETPDDDRGVHAHDRSGGAWVARRFGPAVSEPVRLHVAAKRYLCAQDPSYHDRLSPASRYTMTKQGGPMSPAETDEFAREPHADDALVLRRIEDELGKLPDRPVPPLNEFRGLLERLEIHPPSDDDSR